MDNQIFENLRPYNETEIPAAIERVISDPILPFIVKYLFPNIKIEDFRERLRAIKSVKQFQLEIMMPAIEAIVNKTITKLSFSGLENLSNQRKGMVISNHRDIILDAALLNLILSKHDLETTEISFGNNLIYGQTVMDVGKMNKMFRIIRNCNFKDFYKNSLEISLYMRHVITEQINSVWIAQRNGRTKDGWDKTNLTVLKMFSISSEKSFVDNLDELNITPMVISYEYEPCDFSKTQELYITRYQKYEKDPNEDLQSIVKGITQMKGEVNITIAKPITREELVACNECDRNDKYVSLAKIIDERINSNYKLFKTNYIAYDMLNDTNRFSNFYTQEEKINFIKYMEKGLSVIQGDKNELKSIFLAIYANSVQNSMNL